jgi:hypothetical protein
METLSPEIVGPVSITQFANCTSEVLRSVRVDRRIVPVSNRGQIVAILRPASHAVVAQEVDLDNPGSLVSSSDLERNGPSAVVRAAAEGRVTGLTFQGAPFALVQPTSEWAELFKAVGDIPQVGGHVPEKARNEGSPL